MTYQPQNFTPIPAHAYPPPPPAPPARKRHRVRNWTLGILGALTLVGVIASVSGTDTAKTATGRPVPVVAAASTTVDQPAPVPAPAAADPAPSVPATSTVDAAFLSTVRADGLFPGGTDEQIINAGQSTCAALDSGNSWQTVVDIIMTSGGLDAYDAGYFAGASIGVYCPEYAGEIGG